MKPSVLSLLVILLCSAIHAASWTSGGPHGGIVESMDAAASNPRIAYAAGPTGIFRTDDNGETWRNITGALKPAHVVAVDPSDPDTAYAITGGEFRVAWRTPDGGVTWTPMQTGLKRLNTIAIDPENPQTLYASADCGYYLEPLFDGAGVAKSIDGGRTWHNASVNHANGGFSICVTDLSLDPANPSHLFARAMYDSTPWETFDGAASWVRASAQVPTTDIVIDSYQPPVRYGTNGLTILRSDDEGVHWTAQPGSGLPTKVPASAVVIDFALDPLTPRIFAATIAGLFRSGDGGRSWIRAGDAPQIRVNSVAFNPIDSTVMIATSQGVLRAPSPAFTPWTLRDVPENAITIEQIAADPQRSGVVYASTNDAQPEGRIFRSGDSGANWGRIDERFAWRARVAVDANGDVWFAELYASEVRHLSLQTNEVTTLPSVPQIAAIAAHPAIPGLVYVGSFNRVIRRTSDGGATWSQCQLVGGALEQLVVHPTTGTIYAGTLTGLFRSTDDCTTFQQLDRVPVDQFAVAPSNPAVAYRAARDAAVSMKRFIWRSDDAGTTWTATSLADVSYVSGIVVDPANASHVWIGDRQIGVWESTNGGATWRDLSSGLPSRVVTALAIDRDGTTLHAGVAENGVWDLPLHRRIPTVRKR